MNSKIKRKELPIPTYIACVHVMREGATPAHILRADQAADRIGEILCAPCASLGLDEHNADLLVAVCEECAARVIRSPA
jgi:hypothetical protein